MSYITNTYVPYCTVKPKKAAPWSNSHIRRLCNTKKRLWRKCVHNASARNIAKYKMHCKVLKKTVYKARCAYEKTKFVQRKTSPSGFYSYVENRIQGKVGISPIVHGDRTLVTNEDKAWALSEQYKSVFTVDNGELPITEQKIPPNSLTSIQVKSEDVLEAINAMNTNSAPGLDEVHPLLIKNVRCYLVEPLRVLFQKSLDTGTLPRGWKKGVVIPVYKNNKKPNAASSYRPICLMSVVSKLMEKIIHKYLSQFFARFNLLSKDQHGFLQGKSTCSNLLLTLNEWTSLANSRKPIDAIYIDLAKAFDSVSHAKLIHKLKKVGIGGTILLWLQDYLNDRKQSVRVGSYIGPEENVLSGVPL